MNQPTMARPQTIPGLWQAMLAVLFVVLSSGSAVAQISDKEEIEADVSSRRIAIESDFAGTHIIIFGAVDNSKQRAPEEGIYDVVITIRGPKESTVVRRKDKVAGIWINQASRIFENVPSYYSVLSTRPLEEIASPEVLAEHRLGFSNLEFRLIDPQGANNTPEQRKAFRDAIVRLKQEEGLYKEGAFQVGFISRSLFRGTADLPANVPVGLFDVEIFLFRQGKLLSTHKTQLDIEKAGFERFVFNLAYDQPLLYGIAAVLIAMAAGLAASAVFRKG